MPENLTQKRKVLPLNIRFFALDWYLSLHRIPQHPDNACQNSTLKIFLTAYRKHTALVMVFQHLIISG